MRHITKLSDYDCRNVIFFLLSDYRNIKYRIGECRKLSDYRISDLGLNLSDYRISDSEKNIGCPPLPNIAGASTLFFRGTSSFIRKVSLIIF
jgi:hypothetical protein